MKRSLLKRAATWLSKNGANGLFAVCVCGTAWAVGELVTGASEMQGSYLAVAIVFGGMGGLLYLGETPQ